MNHIGQIVAANEAYRLLQTDLGPDEFSANARTAHEARTVFLEVGNTVCSRLMTLTTARGEGSGNAPNYSIADYQVATYDTLMAVERGDTVQKISQQALRALLSKYPDDELSAEILARVESMNSEELQEQIQIDKGLCRRVASGNMQAMTEFYERYEHYLHLFTYQASRLLRSSIMEEADLFHEAFIYATRQAKSYRPHFDLPFHAYLGLHLPRFLQHQAQRQDNVHLPSHAISVISRAQAMNQERLQHSWPLLNEEEMVHEFGLEAGPPSSVASGVVVTTGDIHQAQLLTRHMDSTDEGFGTTEVDSPKNEHLSHESIPMTHAGVGPQTPTDDEAVWEVFRGQLDALLVNLAESEGGLQLREAQVLWLAHRNGNSNKEIAEILGISPAVAQRVYETAKNKLRGPALRQKLFAIARGHVTEPLS